MEEPDKLLSETEAEVFDAMRTLAEVSAETVHASPATRAKYADAIAHLVRAQGRLGRLRVQLGSLAVEAEY